MMHKDINHSQEIPRFVNLDESIKEEDNVDEPSSTSYSTETYIKEEIKEEENVDVPSSISYSTETFIKEEIKEEVDEEQGFDDSNLDTDHLVDFNEYV